MAKVLECHHLLLHISASRCSRYTDAKNPRVREFTYAGGGGGGGANHCAWTNDRISFFEQYTVRVNKPACTARQLLCIRTSLPSPSITIQSRTARGLLTASCLQLNIYGSRENGLGRVASLISSDGRFDVMPRANRLRQSHQLHIHACHIWV